MASSGVEIEDDFEEVIVGGDERRAKDEFSFLPKATTFEDQVELSTPAWFRRIARGAFAQFVREFFDGEYKDRLISLAPGTAVNFTTIPGANLDSNADKRYIQIARKMAQLFQKLPCILITDTGETITPSGLGYYDRQQKVDIAGVEYAIRTRSRLAQVPLDIVVASRDEDSADELADVIGIIIENRNVVGSLLNGANWEVRLPTTWSPSSRSTQPIGDDQTNTFGMVSITAEVGVEVWWYEKSPSGFSADKTTCSRDRLQREFIYKPKTPLNAKYKIRLRNYPTGTSVYSKNGNIVLISDSLDVIPIHLGTTSLIARSPAGEVLDEFPFEVTL
jgi:hypothetical protein